MMDRPFPAYTGDEPYIFVSYSHTDSSAVFPEITRLKDQGFNIWYDEGIEAGTEWREELARAVKNAKLLLYFVTPDSVQSENCKKEVNFSIDESIPIIAVHLVETTLPDGLKMTLSDRQAILRHKIPQSEYRQKLSTRIASYLDQKIVQPTPVKQKKTMSIVAGVAGLAVLVAGLILYNLQPASDTAADKVTEATTSDPSATADATQPDLGGIKLKRARYTGKPMSVNYQDEAIQTVLTDISDSADMNLVASSNLDGIRITLALKDVPWDEILDIIAVTKGLEIQVSDRTILITRGAIDGSQ